MVLQKMKRGIHYFFLFFGGDAASATSEFDMLTIANLNEYQCITILHDQVNFTILAAIVFSD